MANFWINWVNIQDYSLLNIFLKDFSIFMDLFNLVTVDLDFGPLGGGGSNHHPHVLLISQAKTCLVIMSRTMPETLSEVNTLTN